MADPEFSEGPVIVATHRGKIIARFYTEYNQGIIYTAPSKFIRDIDDWRDAVRRLIRSNIAPLAIDLKGLRDLLQKQAKLVRARLRVTGSEYLAGLVSGHEYVSTRIGMILGGTEGPSNGQLKRNVEEFATFLETAGPGDGSDHDRGVQAVYTLVAHRLREFLATTETVAEGEEEAS